MRSVRGATKKSQPRKGTQSTKRNLVMCSLCLFVAKKKGGLLKTGSRKTALFEEPTYLACRNAKATK
jgi:hypothetical protein